MVIATWPDDTIAALFHRATPESPWRLHALHTGGAGSSDCYDAGWNSQFEANLYALTGGGPGLPYLHRLIEPDIATSAVWSSVGWLTHEGTYPDWQIVDADPVELGYQVLASLPEIALMEVGRIIFCETCAEEQDCDALCGHIWWCDTDGWYRGAVYDSSSDPCGGDCYGCEELQGIADTHGGVSHGL